MEEDIQTQEDVAADNVADEYEGADEIQAELFRRAGTKLPEPEVEGAEDVTDEEAGDTAEVTEDTKPDALFTLDDGTAVTDSEEARAGYLRHADYTRKTQELAEKRKRIDAIYAYYEANPGKLQELIAEMTNPPQSPQSQTQAQVQQLQVPDNYKGDQFVETTVAALNQMRGELVELKGGYDTMRQDKTAEQQQTELRQRYNVRLTEGYKYLEGKVGESPSPAEFEKRIIEFVQQQENPQAVGANIISDDPLYIRAVVDRTFEADIGAAQSDKVASAEQERGKRKATSASLRVAGRTSTPQPRALPKGRDGKLDSEKALGMILEEQEKLARGT
jgi:hypothetical protein